jgi:murein endopeptidase
MNRRDLRDRHPRFVCASHRRDGARLDRAVDHVQASRGLTMTRYFQTYAIARRACADASIPRSAIRRCRAWYCHEWVRAWRVTWPATAAEG